MLNPINTPKVDKQGRGAGIRERFRKYYGTQARIHRAPGRVNLIGEHTDYNDGFVLPAAIEASAWVAIAPRHDRRLKVFSENYDEHVEIDLDSNSNKRNHWSDYVAGTAASLGRLLNLRGANVLIHTMFLSDQDSVPLPLSR
jgi:galactokinase